MLLSNLYLKNLLHAGTQSPPGWFDEFPVTGKFPLLCLPPLPTAENAFVPCSFG